MVHVDSLAIFPAVVTMRTHIGGRTADVTADLLRRCSVATTDTKILCDTFGATQSLPWQPGRRNHRESEGFSSVTEKVEPKLGQVERTFVLQD